MKLSSDDVLNGCYKFKILVFIQILEHLDMQHETADVIPLSIIDLSFDDNKDL